jgi:hypothetical protein
MKREGERGKGLRGATAVFSAVRREVAVAPEPPLQRLELLPVLLRQRAAVDRELPVCVRRSVTVHRSRPAMSAPWPNHPQRRVARRAVAVNVQTSDMHLPHWLGSLTARSDAPSHRPHDKVLLARAPQIPVWVAALPRPLNNRAEEGSSAECRPSPMTPPVAGDDGGRNTSLLRGNSSSQWQREQEPFRARSQNRTLALQSRRWDTQAAAERLSESGTRSGAILEPRTLHLEDSSRVDLST